MNKYLSIVAFVMLCFSAVSQDLSRFEKKIFIVKNDTLRYRILYPEDYNFHKKYPVITFLHGSGERGRDNELQLVHGGTFFLNDTVRKKFHAIVIFPQMPADSTWDAHTVYTDNTDITGKHYDFTFSPRQTVPSFLVKKLLNKLIHNHVADPNRMYIGGLSFGGMGTFDMLERFPAFFAAAFPICGGGDITKAARFANHTAVWIFHGGADSSVNVKYSRDYYSALKNLHADVHYTEYPGVDHNSWDNAFAEKDLLPWMFSKSKKNRGNK